MFFNSVKFNRKRRERESWVTSASNVGTSGAALGGSLGGLATLSTCLLVGQLMTLGLCQGPLSFMHCYSPASVLISLQVSCLSAQMHPG